MKISFIGAGRVGSSAAFSVLHSVDAAKEIVLVDVEGGLAEGEAQDLTHAAFAMERGDVKITGSEGYSAAKGSDVCVVTAGIARQEGQSRDELLKTNAGIIRSVAAELKKAAPNAIVITVTNQVDAINYLMWRETGFPREHVVGMSGVLDTARLHSLGFDGFVVGAHGDLMVPTEEVPPDKLEELRATGASVIAKKGATFYGPAVSINRMVYAVANDTQEILPCSCVLDGEYGLTGLSIGVPASIRKGGAVPVEMDMPPEFSEAAEHIKKQIASLGL
ncbi:MAG: malate dehydrogenase [Candidatus Diapherotrites archaeon]|nr:malate dehydrogenase [Candidatus Diapherotrites archaeon]